MSSSFLPSLSYQLSLQHYEEAIEEMRLRLIDLESQLNRQADLSSAPETQQLFISFHDFKVGDIALFIQSRSEEREEAHFVAFNQNCPHRFLSEVSLLLKHEVIHFTHIIDLFS
jgi:hypothetical protein